MADEIYVIFDGPPSPIAKHFVEVEDEKGQSITVDGWSKHPFADGYWRLGPFFQIDYSEDLKEAEEKIKRLIEAGDAVMRAGDDPADSDEADEQWQNSVADWGTAKVGR